MNVQVDKLGVPIINQFSEDGFIDCFFQIKNLIRSTGEYRFQCISSFDNKLLGIEIRLIKGIRAGFDENMELIQDHVHQNSVEFIRTGDESDRLISAIAQLYELELLSKRMVDAFTFTGIALHQGDIDIETEPVKLKLFGNDAEADSDEDYFESFLNLNFTDGFVSWNEKDQDYREPLLRSLSISRK